MNRWHVHIRARGHDGRPTKRLLGSYSDADLPAGLEEAFRLAGQDAAGIQVVRESHIAGAFTARAAVPAGMPGESLDDLLAYSRSAEEPAA
jgi:hypothetical protein